MASIGLNAFIAGAANTGLKTWERREQMDADLKKAELLEKLRQSTSDYEFARNKAYESTKTDRFQSGIEGSEYVMRNEQGQEIGRRAPTANEMAEVENKGLDTQYKRAQIDNVAIDNARADRQLAIQESQIGESRADRAERREARKAQKSEADTILLSEFRNARDAMKASGANDAELAAAEARWYSGVNEKGWSKAQQRKYIGTLLNIYAKKRSLESSIFDKDPTDED